MTVGELLNAMSLQAELEFVVTRPDVSRLVERISFIDDGGDSLHGALLLQGSSDALDWAAIARAASGGAVGIIIPRAWGSKPAPYVAAIAESRGLILLSVPVLTDWSLLYRKLDDALRAHLDGSSASPEWGTATFEQLLRRLPVPESIAQNVPAGARVMAFAVRNPDALNDSALLDRAVWLALLDPDVPPGAQAARIDRTIYVTLATAPTEAELRGIASRIRGLMELTCRTDVLAAIGGPAARPQDIADSRTVADEILGLTSHFGGDIVSTMDDVQHLAFLREAASVLAAQPQLLSQKLARLRKSDETRNTSYVAVLRAFLENLGDVNTSAEQLGMHHNTFRYRLKRAVEVGGINLEDPAERLALQVELAFG